MSWIKGAKARDLIVVMDRREPAHFNGAMKFEQLLKRWTEAEVHGATYRLCRPGCDRPEVDFLCAQLKAVANQWYAELLAELARERRRLPRL